MPAKKIFRHVVISAYLFITALALLYTLTGLRLNAGWPVVHFSYGMMAPYQSYEPYAQELLVEGQVAAGTWQPIDMALYWPFLRAERAVRGWLVSWRHDNEDPLPHYRRLATSLQQLEAEQGRDFSAIRLRWQTWPVSPAGYYALRQEPFVTTQLILQIP